MVTTEPKKKLGEEAGKRYNDQAEKFAKTDKGESGAEEARRAIDGPEANELRRAERRGRAPAQR